ncbi:Uncharacterised protein [Nocardia brasiliensis]|nr:Uncharacterised protein [Nocardia brasiliensis]
MNGFREYPTPAKPFAAAGRVVHGQKAFRIDMKKGSEPVRERSERTKITAACAVTVEPSVSEVVSVRERSERTKITAACAVTVEPSASEAEL